jgi:hypothetical protein
MVAYGLTIQDASPQDATDMEQFCMWNNAGPAVQGLPATYFTEVACLHGFAGERRHQDILMSAFDADEDMIAEIEDVLGQSY